MNDLPNGWKKSNLEYILSLMMSGKRPKGGVKGIQEGLLSLGGEHIGADGIVDLTTPRYIPHEFAQSLSDIRILPSDILIVKDGATTGKTAFADQRFEIHTAFINEHIFLCRVNQLINDKFVFYYLRSQNGTKEILSDFRGAAQGGIGRTFAEKVQLPVAPLNEQRRIVAKLDRLFANSRHTREELEHIPKLIKRYKQAVLAAAFRGDLTADWREDNSSSFNTVSLFEVCLSITDGDHQAPPKSETGIPFITISAINDGTLQISKATRFVPNSYFDALSNQRKPQKGDILFSVTGSIGIPVIVDTNEAFVFQRHIAILRVNREKLLEKYLFYILGSEQIRKQGLDVATGTAQLTIPLGGLRNFKIPLFSLEEQKEIIQRVEKLFKAIDLIEEQYQKARQLCDRLERATLAKAFRGELIPQDLNDEPASALLQRILTEKQATPSKKPTSKNTKNK